MTLRRTGRVRPRRATPRRRDAPRWTAADWETATHTLLTRDHGRCPVCGQLITTTAERHHRQRRTVGGDRYANLLLLHPGCHQYVTEHPDEAVSNGWIVRASTANMEGVPVRFHGGSRWLLHDDGTRSPIP